MSFVILGLGTAVPQNRYTQDEAVEVARAVSCETADQAKLLQVIYRQTHIGYRHMIYDRAAYDEVVQTAEDNGGRYRAKNEDDFGPDTAERMAIYEREALPMAMQSTQQALAESGLSAKDITHLVTVSCTGFRAPGFDIGLMRELGMSRNVERTHVGFMGCHGAFNGMRVARAFAASDPNARVLLCATEICSIHYYYPWNPKRIVGNALFADGSAAMVCASDSQTPSNGWRAVASGSCLFPDSEFAMGWEIGNNGFEMTLSAKVPNLIATNLKPWLEVWLAKQNLKIGDIASWAIHPGGPRIINSVEEALGLVDGVAWASREILTQFGNMSSPTVMFILDRLRRENSLRPCVALGFGPGLVAEAALFA